MAASGKNPPTVSSYGSMFQLANLWLHSSDPTFEGRA